MDKNLQTGFAKFCLFFILFFSLIVPPVHPAGTETLITGTYHGVDHQLPKIHTDRVVWQEGTSAFQTIHLYNITSGVELQVTDNSSYVKDPAIYGDLVSYTDCGSDPACSSSAIYLYNIRSGTRLPLSPGLDVQDYSAIYGNRIVWQNIPSAGTTQIYINGTSPVLAKEVNASGNHQESPAIYDSLVAYTDCGGDPACSSDSVIYTYDILSGTRTQISSGSDWAANPAVDGSRVVWQEAGTYGDTSQIFINGTNPTDAYSLTPDEPLVDHQYPAISGSWVVWFQTNRTHTLNADIFANDTGTHQKIPIALDRNGIETVSVSYSPGQSLYRIVWDEQDASGYNIYLSTSGTTRTCPVAGFTNDFVGGAAPVTVKFSDTSSTPSGNPATHWFWDFGDGTNSTLQNPAHPYSANRPYDVTFTTGNSYCRNTTTVKNSVVAGAPVARFSASATSTVVNAPVSFTDSSLGSPTLWNWSWGDGGWTNGTTRNPQHAYAAAGTYSVTLIAANSYGSSTTTKSSYLTVKPGANADADTTISGISTSTSGSRQLLVFNISTLSSYTLSPDSAVLTFTPPAGSGFATASITTSDTGGFGTRAGNISGNISAVHLQTNDIVPTGFSTATGGPYCSVNYSVNLSSYPVNAGLNTQVWESSAGSDSTNFNTIASGSGFSGTNGTAYTTKITKTNFPSGATATLHMSLNATWVAGKPYGRNEIYIERIDDGGTYGQVLATHYRGHNATANLDYFEADSPNGLSTFGLSALEGSGNLFQMVALSVSSQIDGSSSGGSEGGGGAPGTSHSAAVPPAAGPPEKPPDSGISAKLYFNANGIITQATSLRSNDHYATLVIEKGTVVTSADGTVPALVTMRGLQVSEVPSTTDRAAFTGRAYDLGPAGAAFSPAATLTLTNPKTSWGNVYTIRSYNPATQSWLDLPTTYDSATNTFTAKVSHFCCFALFAQPVESAGPPQAAVQNTPAVPAEATTPAPPAPTAMSTFVGLVLWIAETTPGRIYLVIIAGAAVALVVFMRRRRPKIDQLA